MRVGEIVELERCQNQRDRFCFGEAVEIIGSDDREIDDAAAHLIGGLE